MSPSIYLLAEFPLFSPWLFARGFWSCPVAGSPLLSPRQVKHPGTQVPHKATWQPGGCVCNDLGFIMQVPSAQELVRVGMGSSCSGHPPLASAAGSSGPLQHVVQPKGLLAGEGTSSTWRRVGLWIL